MRVNIIRKTRTKTLLYSAAIALSILITSAAFAVRTQAASSAPKMVIYAIDLGENNRGEATMVVDGSGGSILIDTGDYYDKNDEKPLFIWLKEHNYRNKKFDLLITHWHIDHMANAVRLIKDYNIGTVYYPDPGYTNGYYKNLCNDIEKMAKQRKTKFVQLKKGQTIRVGNNVSGEVLYVNGYNEYNSDKNQRENNQSAAIKFTCGKRSFLTCGDAERQEEKALLQLGDKIQADVFKMNHHGYYEVDGRDYTWEFIKKVAPSYSWFTTYNASPTNFKPASVREIVRKTDSKSNVFSTRYNGTIRFDCTNKGIAVSAERNTCKMYRVLTNRKKGNKSTVTFIFNKGSIPTLTDLLIDSETYTSIQVNSKGGVFTGTKKEDSSYLRAGNGLYAVDTLAKDGNTYYWFTKNGTVMKKGWRWINGKKYYFKPERATGFVEIEKGKTYYFTDKKCPGYTPAKEGTIYKGFLKIRDKNNNVRKYYFIDKNYSHYTSAMAGRMATGWKTVSGNKYYMAENGIIVTGVKEIDGNKYLFNGEGIMQTGLRTIKGYKYYFDERHAGKMLTAAPRSVGDKLYYFGSTGRAYTNRYGEVNGVRYWFDRNGVGTRVK